MKSNLSRAIGAAVLGVVTALTLGACSRHSDTDAPPAAADGTIRLSDAQLQHIRRFTVAATQYHRTVEANGTVDYDNDRATSVLAPFSGPVSRTLVSPGDAVRKGDPLAAVDSPDFASAVSGYQKAIATARTNRRLADLDKDLLEHNGVAQREAAQAETDATNAEADRDAALQALVALNVPAGAIADIQQGRPVPHLAGMIRSPIAGTVIEKLVQPGQLLEAGTTPTFTVADMSRVWVMVQLFGADVAEVKVGDTAEVVVDAGTARLQGRVDNIPALVDPDTRAVVARVIVENPDRVLRKQMYVHALLHAKQESSGTLVPVSSILHDDENLPFVYLEQADGTFARRHVTVGYRAGDRYDISEGLKAGDKIVDDGSIFIQFMQSQ